MSLSRLLSDAVLLFGGQVKAGYETGTASAEWRAQQAQEGDGA